MPLGLVWWQVAPLERLVRRGDGVFAVGSEREAAIAADGWFALCAAVAGVVIGLVVALLVRRRRLGALAGLVVGGVLGSVVAWRLGVLLGPEPLTDAARLRQGTHFEGPLRLSALGVLLVWPVTSAMVFFAAVAGLDAPERREAPAAGARLTRS